MNYHVRKGVVSFLTSKILWYIKKPRYLRDHLLTIKVCQVWVFLENPCLVRRGACVILLE